MSRGLIETEFSHRATFKGRLALLDPDAAVDVTNRARTAGVRILGIEGFILEDDAVRATLNIADYSSTIEPVYDDALQFITMTRSTVTHFELVLDEPQ